MIDLFKYESIHQGKNDFWGTEWNSGHPLMNNCNYLDKTGMESHEVERQFLGSWATADPYVTLYKKERLSLGWQEEPPFFDKVQQVSGILPEEF